LIRSIAATKVGARKVPAARSSDVQAWVTERSQASSPGTVRLRVQTALSLQMLTSKIISWCAVRSPPISLQDHSERIITLHAANGNRCWPTASADTSTSTPGAQVDRLAPLQSAPGHARSGDTLACVSPDACVLSRVLVIPSTVCLRGSFGVGRGWQMVMILGPHHEPPVLRTLVNDAR
jgi:hypothetical protein